MINIIQHTLTHLELEQITRGFSQVIFGQRARLLRIIEVQLLEYLVTTYPTQIITFRIEEQAFEQGAAIGHRRRIARAQSAINLLERFLFIVRGILLHALDDEALVTGDVHHTHLGGAGGGNLLEHGARQRLKGAGHNHVFLLVLNVLRQHQIREILMLLDLLEAHLLDVVEHLENLTVCALGTIVLQETQRAEESGDQKLTPPLLTVQIHVQQIVGIKLRFKPRTAVRNDPERKQCLAVGMRGGLEGQPRRTVQLAHNHALSAIDHEAARWGHQGYLTHEYFLFLDLLTLFEMEGDVQRGPVGTTIVQRLKPRLLGRTNLVAMKI